MTEAERLADAASALVGAPFRLHGRNPTTGLDCVGVLVCALRSVARPVPDYPPYALRNLSYDRHDQAMIAAGFARIHCAKLVEPGDVLFSEPGPMQRHILIAVDGLRLVHAHAGLRRVVTMPGPAPWPLTGHWRLQT